MRVFPIKLFVKHFIIVQDVIVKLKNFYHTGATKMDNCNYLVNIQEEILLKIMKDLDFSIYNQYATLFKKSPSFG